MKLLTLIATLLLSLNLVWSQEMGLRSVGPADFKENGRNKKSKDKRELIAEQVPEKKVAPDIESVEPVEVPSLRRSPIELKFSPLTSKKQDDFIEFKPKFFYLKPRIRQANGKEKFHWKSAIRESLFFLGIQHGSRMAQKKTRREIKGKFFREWARSAKNLGGWKDGDSFLTNYIAHPMQGAVTGRIFINNSDFAKRQEFGKSADYWKSRFKTMAWSAVWSAQFELGPVSEASFGNVGLYDKTGINRMGWVDIVVTPTAGTGVIIGEDIIDKYVLRKWLERKSNSRKRIRIFRTFFTPFQSFTNVLRGKVPWKRGNR